MLRLRPHPSFSLLALLAALTLACQDSTAPDRPLPSREAVPERPEPAALVDATYTVLLGS